jgi:hypothetical protein
MNKYTFLTERLYRVFPKGTQTRHVSFLQSLQKDYKTSPIQKEEISWGQNFRRCMHLEIEAKKILKIKKKNGEEEEL